MQTRSDVPPDTLPVELTEGGIEVEYHDGRRVFYRGVPTKVGESVRTAPGKDVHVLITDAGHRQGVLVYVNERNTEDEILEDTGVGRVLLERGEETTVFPGVTVRESQMRIEVDADPETVDGRVFVFEEDAMAERSFELVAEDEVPDDVSDDASGDPSDDEVPDDVSDDGQSDEEPSAGDET
ncbi:MAG: hypothetical protein ACI8XM_001885 [Haloarculaceae archaeon]|jgi:hypothetical protein